MMKKIAVSILLFSIMSSASAAIKVFYNGETLLEAAQEWANYQVSPDGPDIRLVAGYNAYVGGIFDHLSEKQIICAGSDMQRNEVLKMVADKLKSNVKDPQLSASSVVSKVLIKLYSCNKPK